MSKKRIKPTAVCNRLGHKWTKGDAWPLLRGLEFCERCGAIRGAKGEAVR